MPATLTVSTDNRNEQREHKQRAQAWYAVMGLAALTAGAWAILRWIPDNPFNAPSDSPSSSRYNAEQLTGAAAPMLGAPPSARGAVGGCRLGDVALVQNHQGSLLQTPMDVLLARASRAHDRGNRFDVVGWSARGIPSTSGGDIDGCEVTFTYRDVHGEERAIWGVSSDRQRVTPLNDLARAITNATPTHIR